MLQEAFSCGYQGANPNQAEILFVGLDANFAEDIASEGELYQDVLAYLFDGPKYWETHDTHHPFLLHPSATRRTLTAWCQWSGSNWLVMQVLARP